MRASFIITALAGLSLAFFCAGAEKTGTVNPKITSHDTNEAQPAPFPLEPAPNRHADVSVGKKFRLSGPLISLFKAKSIREVPGKLFRLGTPTRPVETLSSEPQPYSELSPRAWSTIVGWRPSASAFADPVTREGGLTFVNLSR